MIGYSCTQTDSATTSDPLAIVKLPLLTWSRNLAASMSYFVAITKVKTLLVSRARSCKCLCTISSTRWHNRRIRPDNTHPEPCDGSIRNELLWACQHHKSRVAYSTRAKKWAYSPFDWNKYARLRQLYFTQYPTVPSQYIDEPI